MNADAALDDLAFLALSENRIAILETLTDGDPHTRDELMETTDVSRPTLARILDDLETRTWISQRGQTCRITPLGRWVHEELAELLETIADERRLREVVRWFPLNRMTFDVRHLRDARVVLPTETDPIAPIRRAEELLRTGNQQRMLSYQVACDFFEVVTPRVVRGEKTLEAVITPDVRESFLTDSTTATSFREAIESDGANVLVVDETELIFHIVDDVVCLGITDDQHDPRTLVVTENDAIYGWAVETFESHRSVAEPITPDAVTPPRQ